MFTVVSSCLISGNRVQSAQIPALDSTLSAWSGFLAARRISHAQEVVCRTQGL